LGFLAIFGAAPLGGCGYDLEEEGGTVVTETREPLYVHATANLFTNNNYEVPVCWHPASTGSDQAKAVFQQAVRDQWESNTSLRFTGFDPEPCTSLASPWVPVHIRPSLTGGTGSEGAFGIGARLGPGNVFNFAADAQLGIEYNQGDVNLVKLPWFAAHEMGHTLGVIHEHQRPDGDDTSDRCVIPRDKAEEMIAPGHVFATVHDPLSVMHYCAEINNDGSSNILTGLDIIGAQMIYGLPPTATRELGFMRVVSSGGLQPA
jgi:hypothetical protein